jgi:hypothetical protein
MLALSTVSSAQTAKTISSHLQIKIQDTCNVFEVDTTCHSVLLVLLDHLSLLFWPAAGLGGLGGFGVFGLFVFLVLSSFRSRFLQIFFLALLLLDLVADDILVIRSDDNIVYTAVEFLYDV